MRRPQLNPNYEIGKERLDKGVPIFNFDKNFAAKMVQLNKSKPEIEAEKSLNEEKRKKFKARNMRKWLERKTIRDNLKFQASLNRTTGGSRPSSRTGKFRH
jgi:hypothetical protein